MNNETTQAAQTAQTAQTIVNRKLIEIKGMGVYQLSAILGMSNPYPLDEEQKLFGLEFYLSSGHTTLLRDTNPQYLLAVRNEIAIALIGEKNNTLPREEGIHDYVLAFSKRNLVEVPDVVN